MRRICYAWGVLCLALLATGCQSSMRGAGGCATGQCGVGAGGGAAGGLLGAGMAGAGGGAAALSGMHRHQYVGAQSHLGPAPGPANGPAAPTVGYPYYTTRGPRDFLAAQPPSIGR